MSREHDKAVMPSISYDRDLAGIVEYIDVDPTAITYVMRLAEMTEEQIIGTTVIFCSTRQDGDTAVLGEYELEPKTIRVFIRNLIFGATEYEKHKTNPEKLEGMIAATLAHEIKHRAHDARGTFPGEPDIEHRVTHRFASSPEIIRPISEAIHLRLRDTPTEAALNTTRRE